jgi:hypothetical protein
VTTRPIKTLLAVSLAVTASALAPALSAHAVGSPKETCREELAKKGALHGVCFWSGEGFTGTISVHSNPKPPEVCGNIAPAGSAVNFTNDTRRMYALSGCDEDNYTSQIPPYGSSDDLDPRSDAPAESWR